MLDQVKRELHHVIYRLSGEFSYLNPGVRCKHAWYGNNYGGFFACPDLLNSNSVVYSFGIGEDASFDEAVVRRHGCEVHAFDPTPRSIEWVKRQKLPSKIHFAGIGISDTSGLVDFYLPKNPEYVSGSMVAQANVNVTEKVTVPMKSFADIAHELGHARIDLVKMDIEGAEYDVIPDLVGAGIPITQILIEFHGRFVEDGTRKTQEAIMALRRGGFEIFAVSKTYQEVSFIRRSAVVGA